MNLDDLLEEFKDEHNGSNTKQVPVKATTSHKLQQHQNQAVFNSVPGRTVHHDDGWGNFTSS